MDPNKFASAPPSGWSEEKFSMGQAPPPPYQDIPHPGYPQPGLAYPPQQQAHGGAGYGQQAYPMGQQYPGQPPTITAQPTVYVTQLANPVNDYLCYSIFTMVCCCLPLGIAALIYSISAREANHVGNQMSAERSSRMARILNHVALGVGIGVLILSIVYVVVVTSIINF